MVTSIFLRGLCGYVWVHILTLSPPGAVLNITFSRDWYVNDNICTKQTHTQTMTNWALKHTHHTLHRNIHKKKKKKKACGWQYHCASLRCTLLIWMHNGEKIHWIRLQCSDYCTEYSMSSSQWNLLIALNVQTSHANCTIVCGSLCWSESVSWADYS